MWKKINDQLDWVPYFTVSDVAQHLDIENDVSARLLSRWVKNNRVIRIKRGLYMSREYFVRHARESDFSGMVSAIINPSSYLSKEYVLQKHQVMTEAVYGVTSCTTKNTSRVVGKLGSYLYYHVKSELFGGYLSESNGVITINEATLGKALFDYLYLRPQGWAYGDKEYNLVEDLRLNLEGFSKEDIVDFEYWVEKSGSKKMQDALSNIRRHVWLS